MQNGPARTRVKSRIRTPDKRPVGGSVGGLAVEYVLCNLASQERIAREVG